MAKFEVRLAKEESCSGYCVIEADTLEEAQKMVDDQIYCDDLDVDWEADDTDISVDSIDPYTDDESAWEVVISVDNKIVASKIVKAKSANEALEEGGFLPASRNVLVSAVKVGVGHCYILCLLGLRTAPRTCVPSTHHEAAYCC